MKKQPSEVSPVQDDFDRGLRNRRAVLGDDWVQRSTAGANSFNADFQSLITRYAWHDIWGRPGLDVTTRRLLVLGMTMGLARWEEFELHCRAAIRGGVPLEQIKETLMQGAIYCGVPAANTAFKITLDILKAEGIALDPEPLTPGVRVSHHHTFSQPQLHVALQGVEQGVPIVMSHALGLDMSLWDELAQSLATSHPVLRYDHRGHGGSARAPGPYTLHQLVDDAARVIKEWGRGPVVFVGLSMGGMVGQGLALKHPELLRGLVLANTTAQYPAAAQEALGQRIAAVNAGGMAAVVDVVMGRYVRPEFVAEEPAQTAALRARVLRADPACYVATCHAIRDVDWLAQLPTLKPPTLVIAGALDVSTTPEMSEAIARAIPGAELKRLENASHLSVLEQAGQFESVLRDWLTRQQLD